VTPVKFRGDLWLQKTRVPALSCGVVCVILRLAVELRLVTDRQTDGRTQGHGYYRGCIASRGKNRIILAVGVQSLRQTDTYMIRSGLVTLFPVRRLRRSLFSGCLWAADTCGRIPCRYGPLVCRDSLKLAESPAGYRHV